MGERVESVLLAEDLGIGNFALVENMSVDNFGVLEDMEVADKSYGLVGEEVESDKSFDWA